MSAIPEDRRIKKLSAPQMALLFEIANRSQSLSDTYLPLLKLVELGLAETTTGKFGGCTASITPKGMALAHQLSLSKAGND